MVADGEPAIQVGRLGRLHLRAGTYLYVGSALGPGGLRARVARHLRPYKRLHWHIDYLLQVSRAKRLFLAYGRQRLEHAWARQLCRQPQAELPLSGFGASDCGCPAHLVHLPMRMGLSWIQRKLEGASPEQTRVHRLSLV